jgi:hypothetical protein
MNQEIIEITKLEADKSTHRLVLEYDAKAILVRLRHFFKALARCNFGMKALLFCFFFNKSLLESGIKICFDKILSSNNSWYFV